MFLAFHPSKKRSHKFKAIPEFGLLPKFPLDLYGSDHDKKNYPPWALPQRAPAKPESCTSYHTSSYYMPPDRSWAKSASN